MPQRREQAIADNSRPLPNNLEPAVKMFLSRLATARGLHGRDTLRKMGLGAYPTMGKDLDHLDSLSEGNKMREEG